MKLPDRIWFYALATGYLVCLSGCRYISPAATDETAEEGVRKPAPAKVMLIESPRVMREDVMYPPGSVKQALFWQDHYAEWRFNLPVKGYAYAGFRFMYPCNLSRHLDHYKLIFTISPASKTRYLWVGLVDGDDQGGNILIELPLKDFSHSTRGGGRTEVVIPISRFPRSGIPAQLDTGMEDSTPGVFDWQDVREIRMINPGGRIPPGDTVITHPRFVR